ncbi:hypothetical protein Scep_028574 [Stephania cephalantha]|uniref:Uncharacterized protein n=1 Tax=Stephania cephalantha TaxID=152367 RepID=A0AAP0EES7_9MAGN
MRTLSLSFTLHSHIALQNGGFHQGLKWKTRSFKKKWKHSEQRGFCRGEGERILWLRQQLINSLSLSLLNIVFRLVLWICF